MLLGKDGVRADAASRTCCLWLLLQLGVEKRGLHRRLYKCIMPQMWVHLLCAHPALRGRRGQERRASPLIPCGADRAGVSPVELLRMPGSSGQFQHQCGTGLWWEAGRCSVVFVVCKETEEELSLCPSSSLTDTVKNNTVNPNIHYEKLPACGFSSEAKLPRGSGELRSSEELWRARGTAEPH